MSEGTAQFDRLLNPGFCGLVASALVEGASNGDRSASGALPLLAVYLLMPMILHKRTAHSIGRASSRGLVDFVARHPDLLVGLDRRIEITASSSRAGLAVALRRGSLQFDPESRTLIATGVLRADRARLSEVLSADDEQRIHACSKLGKWASQMSVALVCDVLCVRPMWVPGSVVESRRTNQAGVDYIQ